MFSKPMRLATAEQMMNEGTAQETTSRRVKGYNVTIVTESTVNIA